MLKLFKKKKPEYILRLEKYWNDAEPGERYRLVKYRLVKGEPSKDEWYWKGSGDAEWAKKEAAHYGIPIQNKLFDDEVYD